MTNLTDNPHKKRLDEIRFSFSALSTFETCKHAYLLTYLTEDTERFGNFFSDYGLLCHDILEKFFRDELQVFQLADYYQENYEKFVTHLPPFFIKTQTYYKQGLDFFSSFTFDRDAYDVISIEDKIDVDLSNDEMEYKLVVKPDLVLKHKETGKTFLMDYKTSFIYKNGKLDKDKLAGYRRQMTMYAKYLKTKDIDIDEVWLWFIRDIENPFYNFSVKKSDEKEVVKWIEETIKDIYKEEDFEPNVQPFFCKNLCSVSSYCKHWKE